MENLVEAREIKLPVFQISQIPEEFDLRPPKLGFTMRGWDFTRAEILSAISQHRMLNPALELASNICPWNCDFCFTEDPKNLFKHKLKNEMSLEQRLSLIDEVSELGAKTINWVGAGEPTIDPNFWRILERIVERNITPVIYTEGTIKLSGRNFIKKLYKLGATIVLKVNSLWNAEYQNAIVKGKSRNPKARNYTKMRNRVIELLLEEGFADSDPTRLAFDTIITRQNFHEVQDIHRYARKNNIFVLFVNYLPSGRSSDGSNDAISLNEQFEIFEKLAEIDAVEFGITHATKFPYAGGVPCSIRGTGLFVKITGATYDCPGEMIPLDNCLNKKLSDIWAGARAISNSFDGKCKPREMFWKKQRNIIKREVIQQVLSLN
jgi:MoaA/NifB/PqqE/SkfB family radical SAM enzyme